MKKSKIQYACRKMFVFDLSVNDLKKEFGESNYTKGYNEMYKFFCKAREFEHIQGSAYISDSDMQIYEVYDLIKELKKNCPWTSTCLRRIDIADIKKVHDLTGLFKDGGECERDNEKNEEMDTCMSMDEWKENIQDVKGIQIIEKDSFSIEKGMDEHSL